MCCYNQEPISIPMESIITSCEQVLTTHRMHVTSRETEQGQATSLLTHGNIQQRKKQLHMARMSNLYDNIYFYDTGSSYMGDTGLHVGGVTHSHTSLTRIHLLVLLPLPLSC